MNFNEKRKDGPRVINRQQFDQNPDNFELRINDENAPLCPFGNQRKFIGFDKEKNEYVRFTKSVLKKVLAEREKQDVA